MDVSKILEIVANISMNEDNPDAELQARLLNYLNMAYTEVFREIAPLDKTRYMTAENITITNGVGAFTAEPSRIHKVVDNDTNRNLTATDILQLEDNFSRDLTDTGDALYYYITNGTQLNTYPLSDTTVRAYTTATANELTTTSLEADIRIPTDYQDILVPLTLYHIYKDERDVRSLSEKRDEWTIYQDKLSRLKNFITNTTSSTLRTTYWDY